MTFDELAHWINRPSAKLSLHREKEQLTYPPDRVMIEFELPPDETAEIDDHEELRLTSGAQPLDKILDDVKYLQDLLTLATNAPTAPLEITLSRSGKAMKYYAGQLAERARLDAPRSAGRILFEFSAIGGLSTIARWVNVARTYQIVVGSLLSIRYASGLYVENRFNNVVSAAETFHRMRFSNQIMPKAEFKKLCHKLVAAEMAFYAGDAFAAVYDDQEQWAKVVTEIRNRLTHHDQNRAIAFEPGDLHFLTESVFMLVMICLFRECQMEDKVLSAIAASGSTQSLRTKLAPVIPRLQAHIAKK